MAPSTTIWVSMKTKELADRLKGKRSYNQHYADLMEMFASGGIKTVEKPVGTEKEPVVIEKEKPVIVERCSDEPTLDFVDKQILIEEIRETVASTAFNPIVMEQIRHTIRKEVENQFWLNYPKYCRNCGYPTISGASESVPVRKDSIFTMLV